MSTATQPKTGRWRVLLLAALAFVLAVLLPTSTASASGLPAAQTRVGAIQPTLSTIFVVAEHIDGGQHRCRSQLQVASGHRVAAGQALALASGTARLAPTTPSSAATTASDALDVHAAVGSPADDPAALVRGEHQQDFPTTPPTGVAAEGRGADFVVDTRGTTIPTEPGRLRSGLENPGAFKDVSTNPATSRKFVGVDDGDPLRIRVEKVTSMIRAIQGPSDPLHTIDHLHVERRANGATGPWTEAWKMSYSWPF